MASRVYARPEPARAYASPTPAPPLGIFSRGLDQYTELSESDCAELDGLCAHSTHLIAPRRDLIREGDVPRSLYVILDGWACHYRSLEDGRRQILDFAVPGDMCDLNLFILDAMDHSIGAITPLRVAEISREAFHRVVGAHPNVATALWRQELVSKSISREWILNIGQRAAPERIAHLFCEMFLRLESVGLSEGCECDFPATQADIADATGLTAVHVNRTMQQLRRLGLVELDRHKLTIRDMAALQRLALFHPDYLHQRRPAHD